MDTTKIRCKYACPKLISEPIIGTSYQIWRIGILMTQDGGNADHFMRNNKLKTTMLRRPSQWCMIAEAENSDPTVSTWYKAEHIPGGLLLSVPSPSATERGAVPKLHFSLVTIMWNSVPKV